MLGLPIIDNCDGCGACCMSQCSPPGYLFPKGESARHWMEKRDLDRYMSLPLGAQRDLEEYIERLNRGETGDADPCCWFDLETRRCKWYEHRPQICRDFDVGEASCRLWRIEHDINGEGFGEMRRKIECALLPILKEST